MVCVFDSLRDASQASVKLGVRPERLKDGGCHESISRLRVVSPPMKQRRHVSSRGEVRSGIGANDRGPLTDRLEEGKVRSFWIFELRLIGEIYKERDRLVLSDD